MTLGGNSIFPETPVQVPADPEDQVRMVERSMQASLCIVIRPEMDVFVHAVHTPAWEKEIL